MKALFCEQRTPDWYEARLGKCTASHMSEVMAYLKRGGETRERWKYKLALAAEILTGDPTPHYVSTEMQWGIDHEDQARTVYQQRTNSMVLPVGFVFHPTIEAAGCSPDGLIGTEGGIEIKCPMTATHLQGVLDGVVPDDYMDQIQFNLACTERDWWDYVSFDPRVPERYQLFVLRVLRDDGRISELNDGVRLFLAEVNRILENLKERMPAIEREYVQDIGELGISDDDIRAADPSWNALIDEQNA